MPSKVFSTPAQRCSWPTLPCSWRTQRAFFRPRLFSSSPTASPAIVSSWPMWVSAPNALDCRGAGVHGDHRVCRPSGAREGALHGVGLGERDDDAVDALVDGGVHELRLLLGLVVVRVQELDVVLDRGLLGAVLDDVPERVAVARVGDHREGPAGRVHRGPALGGRRLAGVLGALAAGTAAPGQGQRRAPLPPRCLPRSETVPRGRALLAVRYIGGTRVSDTAITHSDGGYRASTSRRPGRTDGRGDDQRAASARPGRGQGRTSSWNSKE